jgi:hypothetical protein
VAAPPPGAAVLAAQPRQPQILPEDLSDLRRGARHGSISTIITGTDPGEPGSPLEVPGGQGVQIGDHNRQVNSFIRPYIANLYASAGMTVHSAYLRQVKRIAPQELHGRDKELEELAMFCTAPHQVSYAWWRAPAWAGKSALMSWFVLHPPPGVQIISFFVTARWRGQDNRDAFIDSLLEQLADLLRKTIPAYLTEATREIHMLHMLVQAAEQCQDEGRRLVLVVDGLDEDRGVVIGPDAYSIAALLPTRPEAGLRVIVAGRHDPPIPEDVSHDHPLRDPGIVRVLAGSHWAAVVKADMHRELKRLLYGSQAEQDLLGLVAAAGGGLSAVDLADLTGLSAYDIEENLRAVAGRTFTTRTSQWQPRTSRLVYVLGHEELQNAAVASLGQARLTVYQERLHAWAQEYGQRGWPAGSPEYLLHGYFRLLQDTADIPRLMACATDQRRHDRMLEITGGDTAALTEITAAQNLLLRVPDSGLPGLGRLNFHRSLIAERNAHVPVNLPAVWETIGYPERAEALARAITDAGQRSQALSELARAAANAGESDRCKQLTDQAIAVCQAITDPVRKARMLGDLAWSTAMAEDLDRAQAIARQITVPAQSARVLAGLAEAAAAAGDLGHAEAISMEITDPIQRARVLHGIAEAAVTAGDLDRAEAISMEITDPSQRAHVLHGIAEARAGKPKRVRRFVRFEIPDPSWKTQVLVQLAEAAATAGDLAQAEAVALEITILARRAQVLAGLAGAALAGDQHLAWRLARRATDAASAIPDRELRDQVMRGLEAAFDVYATFDLHGPFTEAGALPQIASPGSRIPVLLGWERDLGSTDHWGQAARRAELAKASDRPTAYPDHTARRLVDLTQEAAGKGDWARVTRLTELAEAAAWVITDPDRKAQALVDLTQAAADKGDWEHATRLTERAEAAAWAITDPERKAQALSRLTDVASTAVAEVGDLDPIRRLTELAEATAWAITDPDRKAQVLVDLRWTVDTGDTERVTRLTERAAAAALTSTNLALRAQMLVTLARGVAGASDRDLVSKLTERADATVWATAAADDIGRAEAAAHTVADPDGKARALATLAQAAADAGDQDRARGLAESAEAAARAITDPEWQAQVLVELARAVADIGDQTRGTALAARAEAAAQAITSPDRKARALATLAHAASDAGDRDRARELAETAEAAAHAITDLDGKARALAILAQVAADAGDQDQASELAEQAETAAQAITDSEWQAQTLVGLARAIAGTGDKDAARALAEKAEAAAQAIVAPSRQVRALAELAQALADMGDRDWAEAITMTITDPDWQAQALATLARAAVDADDLDHASALAERAMAPAQAIADPEWQVRVLGDLARAAADAGDLDRACVLTEQAEEAALVITDTDWQAQLLARLAKVTAGAHNRAQVKELIGRALVAVREMIDRNWRSQALTDLAAALAAEGDLDGAESAVLAINDPNLQTRGLADLARLAESSRARSLLARALMTGHWMSPMEVLVQVDPATVIAIADEYLGTGA